MITIYKYPLNDVWNYIEMAKDAKILTIQYQGPNLFLWAEVNLENPLEYRKFMIIGTGHNILPNQVHRGTVQSPPFVWHIYEDLNK